MNVTARRHTFMLVVSRKKNAKWTIEINSMIVRVKELERKIERVRERERVIIYIYTVIEIKQVNFRSTLTKHDPLFIYGSAQFGHNFCI